jgi:glycosyltransferase involved in cell wall biosynthesis
MKLSFFLLFFVFYSVIGRDTHFFIVIPTYNNQTRCISNIASLAAQENTNWNAFIIDDGSHDETVLLIKNYINNHNLHNKILLSCNRERRLALANIYNAIQLCPNDYVVVLLDGDDALYDSQVLNKLAHIYEDNNVWMTYGQYIHYPSYQLGAARPFPEEILNDRSFRSYEWISSHLRTFYAKLFKQIELSDLHYCGNFFSAAWDLAIMFPLLEMAAPGHIKCIQDILYVYNHHEMNDYRQIPRETLFFESILRKRNKYPKIERLF